MQTETPCDLTATDFGLALERQLKPSTLCHCMGQAAAREDANVSFRLADVQKQSLQFVTPMTFLCLRTRSPILGLASQPASL